MPTIEEFFKSLYEQNPSVSRSGDEDDRQAKIKELGILCGQEDCNGVFLSFLYAGGRQWTVVRCYQGVDFVTVNGERCS